MVTAMAGQVQMYDATYRGFELDARRQVRAETYGVDIGQNGWLTVDEWRADLARLDLRPGSRALDVACGAGGPDLFLARETGAQVVGVDVNAEAVAAATERARREGLASLARFEVADGDGSLPFDDASFDAIVCIDAINHLSGRLQVLRNWRDLLKPGGLLLFTDPIVVTGLLSSEEIAVRASIGYFAFSLREENERLIEAAGLELLGCEDTTVNVARVARRWYLAREARRTALVEDEGEATFDGMQRFLAVAHALAEQRRLSRYTFLARRSNPSIRSATASRASR
jgi:SAM-dependent methyltransferase